MLTAYINYPNPHITIHADTSCSRIMQHSNASHRIISLDRHSLSGELERFASKEHRFASESAFNDMWLRLDFGDVDFERAIVSHIRSLVGQHYKPLRTAQISDHC